MDLLELKKSFDNLATALTAHSASMDKFMAAAGGTAQSGEAQAASGAKRGRPTNAEIAAKAAAAQAATQNVQTTATAVPAAVQGLAASSPSPVQTVGAQAAVNVLATQATGAAGTASSGTTVLGGPLTHLALKDEFIAFAKAKGRDAVVALLGEFGATEFGKVKTEALPLFRDRLLGKPQTPVESSDFGNLLGM